MPNITLIAAGGIDKGQGERRLPGSRRMRRRNGHENFGK